jgi:hypothetical protein
MSGYAVKIRTWPSFLGDSISSCMSRKADAFGGYPAGFDKSNFVFITPYESERKKWSSLNGVNLVDGKTCQIAMQPTINQDRVVPESFRILFRKYLVMRESGLSQRPFTRFSRVSQFAAIHCPDSGNR